MIVLLVPIFQAMAVPLSEKVLGDSVVQSPYARRPYAQERTSPVNPAKAEVFIFKKSSMP